MFFRPCVREAKASVLFQQEQEDHDPGDECPSPTLAHGWEKTQYRGQVQSDNITNAYFPSTESIHCLEMGVVQNYFLKLLFSDLRMYS